MTVDPAVARSAIAAAVLAAPGSARLGAVHLAPHQHAAVQRIAALLGTRGGVLLADDVGMGKTFVALAAARGYSCPVVVAPASLREMWRGAQCRANVPVRVLTYESLSRGTAPPGEADLVILDEAHHARSLTARRRARLAALTAHARVLLITATPLPNRIGELRSLFALFLGERAALLGDDELAALVVRRTADALPASSLPAVRPPQWLEPDTDDSPVLAQLAALPAPIPAAGAGDGGALLALSLFRQWASSRAALRDALRRRLHTTLALEQAIAAGRHPTAMDLASWTAGDDAVQLAFPELVAGPLADGVEQAAMLASLAAHRAAVDALLDHLHEIPDPDRARADCIRRLRARHDGERILCFTSYGRTARMYWRLLRGDAGVAHLTSAGGRIATGAIGRREVLARFAPIGQRTSPVDAAGAITLLISTDILAEGVDLRDATVIVHLDLPWSPARLEQRVGRARRLGSPAPSITVYAMRPPAAAEAVLALEERLRGKIAAAARAVGAPHLVLPARFPDLPDPDGALEPTDRDTTQSATERLSRAYDRIAAWERTTGDAGPHGGNAPGVALTGPLTAMVDAPASGWLAAVRHRASVSLFARVGSAVGDSPPLLDQATEYAEGRAPAAGTVSDVVVADAIANAIAEATDAAAAWAAASFLKPTVRGTGVRRAVLARIDRAYLRCAPHERPRVAALASSARRVATATLPAGVECALVAAAGEAEDEAFLRAVVAAAPGAVGGFDPRPGNDAHDTARIEVLVAFRASDGQPCATPSCPASATRS